MAQSFKTRIKLLKIRLRIAWRILAKKEKHWVLISITEEDMIKMFLDKPFDLTYNYHGLRNYIVYRMVKRMAQEKSDIDMALDKAQFEADATDYKRK